MLTKSNLEAFIDYLRNKPVPPMIMYYNKKAADIVNERLQRLLNEHKEK